MTYYIEILGGMDGGDARVDIYIYNIYIYTGLGGIVASSPGTVLVRSDLHAIFEHVAAENFEMFSTFSTN